MVRDLLTAVVVLILLVLAIGVLSRPQLGRPNVEVSRNSITIEMRGLSSLWAFKRRLKIPLDQVREARIEPDARRLLKGIRASGTHVPGLITAGTYRSRRNKTFWFIWRGKNAVVIDLAGNSYDQIVLEVDDPRQLLRRIDAALGYNRRRAAPPNESPG
jgi:hypothetical protein